jgi:hypothetical protein
LRLDAPRRLRTMRTTLARKRAGEGPAEEGRRGEGWKKE